MQLTLEALVMGDRNVLAYYTAAAERWRGMLRGGEAPDPDELHSAQHWFEQECGGRALGKEIMAVAGIAVALGFGGDDVNEERARALAAAIAASMSSLEVKDAAEQALGLLGLGEDDEP